MAITSYPFDNQDVTESQYSALFRELQDSGIVGDSGSSSFQMTTNSSGLDVQIAPGMAILRGHAIISDAIETVTFAAAHASLPRIDRVVLRLDPTANGIAIVVKAGTPASSPLAPGLTYTDTGVFELSLGEVRVNATALNVLPDNILDQRTWVGQRIGLWTSATRPGSPRKGRLGFNETLSAWEFYNGTAWTALYSPPDLSGYATDAELASAVAPKMNTEDANAAYLPIGGKAADSNLLDGLDSTAFATSGHSHGAGAQVATGTYTGDDAALRTISLAFTPKIVTITGAQVGGTVVHVQAGGAFRIGSGSAANAWDATLNCVTNGFVISQAFNNNAGTTYHYTAIG